MSPQTRSPRRAYRDPDDRILGGVASGVAQHLGLETLHVRIGFLVLALVSGLGVLLYAALWVLLPVRDPDLADGEQSPGLAAASREGRRTGSARVSSRGRDLGLLVSLAVLGLGVVVFLQVAGLWVSPRVFWPVMVATAGLALLWWQTDQADREEWLSTSSGWKAWLRVVLGVVLVAASASLVLFQAGLTGALDDVLLVVLLAVVGVALVIGPWLLRTRRDLHQERAERIRSQERADVAAHLHDSVLQTLALIQRQAHDPQMVAQLARTQERELRGWLFDSPDDSADTLRSALQRAAAEVEDTQLVPVEVVVVGDRDLDSASTATVAAAREAMLNAAKHSGAARVDVYAEVGDAEIEVFVRDRGRGFDPATVPADRLGLRRSIVDRMSRHGGTAAVRSAPADGTEVRLTMPTRQEDA